MCVRACVRVFPKNVGYQVDDKTPLKTTVISRDAALTLRRE